MNYIIGCKFVISRNQCTIMIISFQIIDNFVEADNNENIKARNYSPFIRAIRWRPGGSPSPGDSNAEIASMSKRFYDLTASIILDTWLYPGGN